MDNNQPAMSLANGGVGNVLGQELPPEAINSAKKALSRYYDNHAEQLVSQPGGVEVLSKLVNGVGGLNNNPKILPAKGAMTSASVTPEGDIQGSGTFGGLSTDYLLKQLLKLSEISKNASTASSQQNLTPEGQVRNLTKTRDLMKEQGIEGQYGITATGVPTIQTYTDMNQDIVYRNPITGEEVPAEQAMNDMVNGVGQYKVSQRIKTRAGTLEKSLINPQDLTQEEKQYLISSTRIQGTLNDILTDLPTIYSKKGTPDLVKQFQSEKLPFWMTPDQDIQTLKANLNYLKADIPFLRGGKQLTQTESRRVDVLLNPLGKTEETYRKDIDRFKKEFGIGEMLTKYGVAAGIMDKKKKEQNNDSSSSTSFKVISVREK